MFSKDMTIAGYDDELWAAIENERTRQEEHIELIASENYTSPLVMKAQGSRLTNKYAEGYPGKRYYGGCEFVDQVETLAIERAKELFGADYANVQPHSGSQANGAVYHALVEPGDTIRLRHPFDGENGLQLIESEVRIGAVHDSALRTFAYLDEASAELLSPHVKQYIFISSISVFADS